MALERYCDENANPIISAENPYLPRMQVDRFLYILGQRLEDIMMMHNIGVNELAYEAGLTSRTIYRYRNGLIMPTVSTLNNIAVALGIEIRDLVFDGCYIVPNDIFETKREGVYDRDVLALDLTFGSNPYRYPYAMARYDDPEVVKRRILNVINYRIERHQSTMQDLADACCLSRKSLYRYLHYERFPELWYLINLCKTLGLDFYSLIPARDYILST